MARRKARGERKSRGESPGGTPDQALSPTTRAIERVLRAVPPRRVVTYGQVARLAGLPNGARQVARVLHSRSAAADLPWHRVVGSGGKIALSGDGFEEQVALLESEGVRVGPKGEIDLERYEWGSA